MDDMDMFTDENAADVGNEPPTSNTALSSAEARVEDAHAALEQAEEAVQAAQEKAEQDLSGWMLAAATEALTQNERARDRAVEEVESAAEALAAAREHVAGKTAAEASSSNTAGPVEGDQPTPFYDGPEEFLHEQLLPLYNRILDAKNGKWCRQWFLHPEAVSRVEALWRAWEHLRLDAATGMSVWWRDHADPHMTVLLDPKGPFHPCSSTRHRTPPPIECEYAPEAWFSA
ncbi:DUF4913 domain-containing protein [Arthrobacter rhombi]|uniref:DUF4913 domain-containing protein n=1 Tax=Arthrobacter rhombi TaxID=71253 RepID=UPI003FD348A0